MPKSISRLHGNSLNICLRQPIIETIGSRYFTRRKGDVQKEANLCRWYQFPKYLREQHQVVVMYPD